MNEYHKIQSIFKRNPEDQYRFTNEYSCPEFEYLKDNQWEFTEKVDGTNIRIIWDGENVRFGGKTDNAQIPMFLYDRLNYLFRKTDFELNYLNTPMTLYGEGYGAKIQKGGGNYKSDGVDFILFDILIDGWWLMRSNVQEIADRLELTKIIPLIQHGTLDDAMRMCKEGFKSHWGDFRAEGIVLRTNPGLKDRSGHRIITKVKYKDFK